MTTNHSQPTNSSGPASRSGGKSAAAFRTISEVAQELDVPQHVLRFWDSKFSPVRPLKRGGGRRYYRPEDVDLLRRIRTLLYRDGYTIKGVQRLLREGQGKLNAAVAGPPIAVERKELRVIVDELSELRDILARLEVGSSYPTGAAVGPPNINTAAIILEAALYLRRGRPILDLPVPDAGGR